ncbi:MAG TPA: PD-(D/E)XK nuclease family protein [Ignavibacteriaceae bacterium]|nr:PD-(D/E)XK nuclease family protein [Ignavibacteriaceae bacterium]
MILTKSGIKKVNLDQLIKERITGSKTDTFLLVVPTNRKVRHLKKEFIKLAPGKAIAGINIETIGTLSTKLLSENVSKISLVSEAASSVLLKQSFAEADLNYFINYKHEIPQGTLDRIKSVLKEYKRHGISPLLLENEAEKLDSSEKKKAIDIARIYKIYKEKFSNLNVYETGDIYGELNKLGAKKTIESLNKVYPSIDLIIFSGFSEFSNPEIEIINSLSEDASKKLFIEFDYYENNEDVFSHLLLCYNKLTERGFNKIIDDPEIKETPFVREVKESLFKRGVNYGHEKFLERIEVIPAKDPETEVEYIGKVIKRLITEDSVPPQNISVVFNLIGKYSPLIRDRFGLLGIPYNLTDRYMLDTFLPVISIINFLEILENDFYYRNIFRALSGDYIKPAKVKLINLMKAAAELKIVAGYQNWKETLNFYILHNRVGNNENGKEEFYKNILAEIESIYQLLKPFSHQLTPDEFHSRFEELIFRLDVPGKVLLLGGELSEANFKALDTLLDISREVLELISMEHGNKKKFHLGFYLNQIRTAVSSARFNIKERPNYGVLITTLEEIRGLKFDYLFIGGLCDGDLPTRYSPEVFTSGSFIKGEQKHQLEERYLFYKTLTAVEKQLYLSYPLVDGKKELVESNFLTSFRALFKTGIKVPGEFNKYIYSKDELLYMVGKNHPGANNSLNEDESREITEALKIDSLRLNNSFAPTEFTGCVKDGLSDKAKETLFSLSNKTYSISRLETYALCPFKYFSERVLNLKPIEEPSEEFEAIQLGNLLHSIAHRFYVKMIEKNVTLKNCNDNDFNEAVEVIFNIAHEILSGISINSEIVFFEKEKITGINGNKEQSILYKFLLQERESQDDFEPKYFEIPFGNLHIPDEQSLLGNIKAGNVEVSGKIDRLDINEKEKTFKVVDYKLSGKKPSKNDLNEGLSLQIPLYLYASKKLLKFLLNEDYEPALAWIYSLKMGYDSIKPVEVKNSTSRKSFVQLSKAEKEELINSYNEMIDSCVVKINEYVEKISSGIFNLSTLEDRETRICRMCSFKPVCRIKDFG